MTIQQAIEMLDTRKPNQLSDVTKVEYLDELERTVYNELVLTHAGAKDVDFSGYGPDTDTDTKLIVPEPYSNVYLYWLMAQVDLVNQETSKYANDYILFNNAYQTFADYYNRTHMPQGAHIRY